LADSTVRQRFHAVKKLTLHPVPDEKKELTAKLVELALARQISGRAVLIFARSVEVVHRVAAQLGKANLSSEPVTLTGTLRGWERDRLVENPVFQRFLPSASRIPISKPIPIGTVYLVATSAGEVGVNLSADDLVCDLSTFESIAQRFGRVNRFGELADSSIDIVHPRTFDYETSPEKQQGKDRVEIARERTLRLLEKLMGDASPQALGHLPAAARSAAFIPEPAILPATDILFDAWSLTTIRGCLPGRPPVEPYLHGVAEWEPPQTQVAWRTEVEVITDLEGTTSLQTLYPPEELLADYPLRAHELLRNRSSRVFEQLKKLAAHHHAKALPVWLVEQDGQVTPWRLADLLAQRDAEETLHHRTLLLPPSAGGLRSDGSLDGDALPSVPVEKDIADLVPPDSPRLRQRTRADGPASSVDVPDGFRLIRPPIDTRPSPESSDDDEDTGSDAEQSTAPRSGRYWYWFESTQALDGSNLHYAQASVLLDVHTKDVKNLACSIAEKLRLPADMVHAISLAARFHDAGKNRSAWQKGIGNPTPSISLAKAGRHLRPRETGDRYRHEFGSLLDVATHPDFLALPAASQDLVLHLIAAHHGRARPHFPADEVADSTVALTTVQTLAGEVPLRFARLQRRFGRWGLAYLESILRAADYAASANPSSTLEDSK
jgi:CRISPR-associated endonuclease/helicase Cas3